MSGGKSARRTKRAKSSRSVSAEKGPLIDTFDYGDSENYAFVNRTKKEYFIFHPSDINLKKLVRLYKNGPWDLEKDNIITENAEEVGHRNYIKYYSEAKIASYF